MFKPHHLLCRVTIVTLAAVCYANSLWGDFVFDDSEAIIKNKDIDPVTPLSKVFADDFWGTEITHKNSHKSYRPLTVITFRWNFWLAGGAHPFGFHLTNIILHAAVSLLYYEVCCCLVRRQQTNEKTMDEDSDITKCALISALLFAVHPIHTESVSGVVGRADLTAAICFFVSILTYAKSCWQVHRIGFGLASFFWVLLSVLLGGGAMLFKEQGITVMGVCVIYELIVHMSLTPAELLVPHRWKWRTSGARIFTVACGTAVLLLGRFYLMATGPPEFKPVDNPASFADSLLTRVLSYNYIYSLNAWILLNPWWLCFDWSMGCVPLLESIADPRVFAVLAFWSVFAMLLIFVLSGRATHFKRLITMSLALLVIPFLPACNLFLRVGFVIAERALYLPSAGYCMLLSLALCALSKRVHKFMWYLATVCLLVLFVLRSIQRSSHWLNEESLFTDGIKVCPSNAKVLYNIGKVISDGGDGVVGEAAYREAIRLYPEYDQALNNLGNLLKETKRDEEAENLLHRALESNPEFAAAWMNLGIVQAALNKTGEAEKSYQNAIKHRKKYPDAYFNLGNLYIDMNKTEEAAVAFKSAIALQNDHYNTWSNLALLYENLKMFTEAESTIREAMQIMPNNPHFYYSLGVLMAKTQRLEEGETLLLKAIALNPAMSNYHANLAVILHLRKQYTRAEQSYLNALKLDPNLPTAKENLSKLRKTIQKNP